MDTHLDQAAKGLAELFSGPRKGPGPHHPGTPVRQTAAGIGPKQTERPLGHRAGGRLAVSYWKVIMSVRLSVVAFGFKGSFAKFALPEFKTL
jgi:hypothetical protein